MKVMILLILILCIANIAGAEQISQSPRNAAVLDYTEGGHYDTDYHASFMSEWWYLNGDMKLVAKDGEKKRLAFFAVMAHQESPELQDPNSGNSIVISFYILRALSLRGDYYFQFYPYTCTKVHNVEIMLSFMCLMLTEYTYPEGLRRYLMVQVLKDTR